MNFNELRKLSRKINLESVVRNKVPFEKIVPYDYYNY